MRQGKRLFLNRHDQITKLALITAAALAASSIGCREHRMSLDEFLLIQQEEAIAAEPVAMVQPAEIELMDARLGRYRVGSGDVLAIVVTGLDAELLPPMTARVDRQGNIGIPAVGRLRVEGLELEDIEQTIVDAYVPQIYTDIVVHVSVIEPEATRVLVHGAVVEPGLVPLRRTDRDLLRAISAAGGVTQAASGEVTLRRIREPDKTVTLNLLDPEQLRLALTLEPLRDGDVLEVDAATPNTVFVGGLVNAPRPQPYPPGTDITVLQAIAASAGLRTDVTPREATLIRRMPDGTDKHVKLNLDRIGKGRDPNITLAAGDVLWVPDTLETRVQDWMNRNLFIRAGASATYNLNYNHTGLGFLNQAARQAQVGRTGTLQDQFDPFGFLQRGQQLRDLGTQLPPVP